MKCHTIEKKFFATLMHIKNMVSERSSIYSKKCFKTEKLVPCHMRKLAHFLLTSWPLPLL